MLIRRSIVIQNHPAAARRQKAPVNMLPSPPLYFGGIYVARSRHWQQPFPDFPQPRLIDAAAVPVVPAVQFGSPQQIS